MKMKLLLLTILMCETMQIVAQDAHYDYHPPLKIPLILASNFGELRPNHFHMGLDFKTNGTTGYNLYSVEEGYVSRIKISAYGYGKAIYIDHPNGITSVYAHCSEFKGEIDSIVRSTQKREQNYEVEIFPEANAVKVSKGQIIAISGNTGSSSAPHLHFELRDTKTEHALNPLLYGFDIADSKAPEIRGVKLYGISEDGYRFPKKSTYKTVSKGANGYYIAGNEIIISSNYLSKNGGLGFAADVIDRLDGAANQCGLYGSYLIVDGDTIFGQEINFVPFESTRYVNSHKDFEDYSSLKRKLHKSFKTSENDLPIYTKPGNGVIKARPGQVLQIKFVAFDAKKNHSELSFSIKISEGEINPEEEVISGQHVIKPNTPFSYKTDDTEIEMGVACVYEPESYNPTAFGNRVLSGNSPVNRSYRIKKKVKNNDGKNYLEITTEGSKKRVVLLEKDRDWLIADMKYFGSYKIRRDTIGPSISSSNFSYSAINKSALTWTITDGQSGLADYDLFIDGKWQLLEYEYKNNSLTFAVPKDISGKKELIIIGKDGCGNETEWKRTVDF